MTSEKIISFPTAPILPKVKAIRLRIRALDEAGVPMSEWRDILASEFPTLTLGRYWNALDFEDKRRRRLRLQTKRRTLRAYASSSGHTS
jgi:hypothetical protein